MLPHLEILSSLLLATSQGAGVQTPPTQAAVRPMPATAATTSGMISGVISDDDTNAAISGASVVLECTCLAGPREQTTDARGTFVFDGLSAGAYTLRVSTDAQSAADPIVREASLADGGLVEVQVTVAGEPGLQPTEGQAHRLGREHHGHDHDDDDDDDDDHHDKVKHRHQIWGGLGVGLVFAPFGRGGEELSPTSNRITSNQLSPWTGSLRGIDLRWQTFDLDEHHFPRTIGYFRSGFSKGSTHFGADAEGFSTGEPTHLDVLTVPLFFGTNLYFLRDFPVRPYAGLGVGFDIMRLDFERAGSRNYIDTSARIGFEVHAGLEIRIANYLALTGEVMQLWSARRRFDTLPDVSNENFTALIGITGGFPMRR